MPARLSWVGLTSGELSMIRGTFARVERAAEMTTELFIKGPRWFQTRTWKSLRLRQALNKADSCRELAAWVSRTFWFRIAAPGNAVRRYLGGSAGVKVAGGRASDDEKEVLVWPFQLVVWLNRC